jgi:hypothetical protein
MPLTPSGMIKEVSVFPAGYATNVFLSLLYNMPLSEVYAAFPEPTFIAIRLAQEAKAFIPILVRPSGIVTLTRLLQLIKTQSPMLLTPSGMVMLARLLQLKKAPSPILVTPSGIDMLIRFSQ